MTRFKRIGLLAIGLALALEVGAAGLKSEAVEPERLQQALGNGNPPLLVDVRSPDGYSSGHIPSAVNIPVPLLARRLDELRQAEDLVLYCNDSRLTRMAERILLHKKIKDFRHLEGGLDAWTEADLPIETSLD